MEGIVAETADPCQGLVPGTVVRLVREDSKAGELALVMDASSQMVWFSVIRMGHSVFDFHDLFIHRKEVDPEVLEGAGAHALLERWFSETWDVVARDASGQVLYEMTHIHDPQNARLLEGYLRTSTPKAIFSMLTQSFASMGPGYVKGYPTGSSWSAGVEWRKHIHHECVQAARFRMVTEFLRRESPAQLAHRVCCYLAGFSEERAAFEAIPLIALAWDCLGTYPGHSSSRYYWAMANGLLECALDTYLALNCSLLGWINVRPLAGLEVEHAACVRRSILIELRQLGWHEILCFRRSLTPAQWEALERIRLTRDDLSRIWLEKWEQAQDLSWLHPMGDGLLTPFELARAKDILIEKFRCLDPMTIANLVHRPSGPWEGLFDADDRERILSILGERMAHRNDGLAHGLEHVMTTTHALPESIRALVNQQLTAQASSPPS